MKLRIGIDGGGTTTRAVLIDTDLTVLGRGEAPSSNHYGVGMARAIENIRAAGDAALQSAKVKLTDIDGWGLGLAGACSSAEQSAVHQALSPFISDAKLVVDEDAAAAQAGAFGGEPGAVCIAGTGANCFGINARGERARADGWGPLLGDRGSGYSIGENALRAVCRAQDGAGPATSLLDPVLQSLNAPSFDALIQIVYAAEFSRDRIAALFPLVLQHAASGDAVANSLLEQAGCALAATATAVLVKLELQQVAVTGGVLTQPSALRRTFEEQLRKHVPGALATDPIYDAAIGAALLLPKYA